MKLVHPRCLLVLRLRRRALYPAELREQAPRPAPRAAQSIIGEGRRAVNKCGPKAPAAEEEGRRGKRRPQPIGKAAGGLKFIWEI